LWAKKYPPDQAGGLMNMAADFQRKK